jgi:hypothetical protein
MTAETTIEPDVVGIGQKAKVFFLPMEDVWISQFHRLTA